MPAPLNLDTASPDEVVAWMTRNRVTRLEFGSRSYEVHPVAFAEDARRVEEAKLAAEIAAADARGKALGEGKRTVAEAVEATDDPAGRDEWDRVIATGGVLRGLPGGTK